MYIIFYTCYMFDYSYWHKFMAFTCLDLVFITRVQLNYVILCSVTISIGFNNLGTTKLCNTLFLYKFLAQPIWNLRTPSLLFSLAFFAFESYIRTRNVVKVQRHLLLISFVLILKTKSSKKFGW